MDRMTTRFPDGAVELKCSVNDAVMQLAAYEDTGHTPEEIQNAIFPPCKVGNTVWALWPAVTDSEFIVYCAEVKQIVIAKRSGRTMMTVWLEPINFRGRRKEYFEGDFGKLVFLTSEEAEAVLGGTPIKEENANEGFC